LEHATAGERVGRTVREGMGRRYREPRRRSMAERRRLTAGTWPAERRHGRSVEMVSSSHGESGSGGGLEGGAVIQIPWTAWTRVVLPALVSGGARRASGCGEGGGFNILDLRCALPNTLINPGSTSPFEDVIDKIFDILDGRVWTGHNIRLGVRYTRTVSATLPF
jgi:hypothetical protein